MYRRRQTWVPALGALILATAACGGSGSTASDRPDATSEGRCPVDLIIQADWWPEAEHGGVYQLIDHSEAAPSSDRLSYAGPIADRYAVGALETVEIRSGGDAIGSTPVAVEMAGDDDIYLGFINTDEVVRTYPEIPTIGVVATLDIFPQHIQWDPARHDFSLDDPAAFARSGLTFVHFDGDVFVDHLVAAGILAEDQLDPSYTGGFDRWLGADGDILQQGFATNELYRYEVELDGWRKPVDYVLIHDLGYQPYPAMVSVEVAELEAKAPCLEVLVPAMQRAWVDYLEDPVATNEAIVAITEDFDTYWTISDGLNDEAMRLFESLEIVGNGSDAIYGNFDLDRVDALIEIMSPSLVDAGIEPPEGFSASSVVTNRFIDPTISGPFG